MSKRKKMYRLFDMSDEEIRELLLAADSDDEDGLILDEEDRMFLEEDVDTIRGEVIIEGDGCTPNLVQQVSPHESSFNQAYIDQCSGAGPSSANERQIENTKQDAVLNTSCSKTKNIKKKFAASRKSHNKKTEMFHWKRTDSSEEILESNHPFSQVKITCTSMPVPMDIFTKTCGFDKLVELIVEQSNLYMEQKGEPFQTNYQEMKAFLGMNFVMGYHTVPAIRDYWSTQPDLQVPFIANIMPRTRFETIRSALHFTDNAKELSRIDPAFDRAFKIRPLILHFNEFFQNAREPSKYQPIDEHMIKFKGHNAMKQYIKNKPVKWGFKLWCRNDSETGYLYQFDLYTGKKKNPEQGLGESVVLELSESLQNLGVKLFFDKFFTSPSLIRDLLQKKEIYA